MSLIKLNINPPLAQLKSFGRVWTPLFAIIIGFNVMLNGYFEAAVTIEVVAIVIVLVGWLRPEMLNFHLWQRWLLPTHRHRRWLVVIANDLLWLFMSDRFDVEGVQKRSVATTLGFRC